MVEVLNSIFRILIVLIIFSLRDQNDFPWCSRQVSVVAAGPTDTGVCAANACKKRECVPTVNGDDYRCACPLIFRGKHCGRQLSSCVMLDCEETTHCFTSTSEGSSMCICNEGLTSVFCSKEADKGAIGPPTQLEAIEFEVSNETKEIIEDFTHYYLYVAAGVFAVNLLCIVCHCMCVSKKRKEIKDEYRHMLDKGRVPADLPPDLLGISCIVLKEILCCKKRKKAEAKKSKSKFRGLGDKEAVLSSLMNVKTDSRMLRNSGSRLKRHLHSNHNMHASGSIPSETDYTTNYKYWDNNPRRYSNIVNGENRDSSRVETYADMGDYDNYDPYDENIPLLQRKSAHKSKRKLIKKRKRSNTKNENDFFNQSRRYVREQIQNDGKNKRNSESMITWNHEAEGAKRPSHNRTGYNVDYDAFDAEDKSNSETMRPRQHKKVPPGQSGLDHGSSYGRTKGHSDENHHSTRNNRKHFNGIDKEPNINVPKSQSVSKNYCHVHDGDQGRKPSKTLSIKHAGKDKHHVIDADNTKQSDAREVSNDKSNVRVRAKDSKIESIKVLSAYDSHRYLEPYCSQSTMHDAIQMTPISLSDKVNANYTYSDSSASLDYEDEQVLECVSRPRYVAYSYSETPHLIHIEDSAEPGHKYTHNISQHCSVSKHPKSFSSNRSPGKYRQMMLSKAKPSHNNNNLHKLIQKVPKRHKSKYFNKNRKYLHTLKRPKRNSHLSSVCSSVSSESIFSSMGYRRETGKSRNAKGMLFYRPKRAHNQVNRGSNKNLNANHETFSLLSERKRNTCMLNKIKNSTDTYTNNICRNVDIGQLQTDKINDSNMSQRKNVYDKNNCNRILPTYCETDSRVYGAHDNSTTSYRDSHNDNLEENMSFRHNSKTDPSLVNMDVPSIFTKEGSVLERSGIKEAEYIVADLAQRFPSRPRTMSQTLSNDDGSKLLEEDSSALGRAAYFEVGLTDGELEAEDDSTVVPTDNSDAFDSSDVTVVGQVE